MFRLDLRAPRAPARRDDATDWNIAIARAQTAVSSGAQLEAAFDQLEQDVKSFVEQTKAQSAQLLQAIQTVRSSAAAQAQLYEQVESDYYEDDAPQQLADLYNEANSGDYDSDLDDLAEALENLTG
ncbi:hypothetical protein Hden_2974 [Hyphomicrobium denitrificans ATCC 51888]|uniref:Uncharacterized protein n=1 Tax=Hyphomicrobium denitrificans (strain ATCC 51888 / DSM 1869 / NCIMB 11706 / TK 0415) TaxID=582899 RepID=D8JVB5_HYPDA|nr:hypothetical protein [Hyphomicrobium denitrificans]ADJ24769.1 hypothetical protein Hden_2974 [Hyphomicrobium denitrificans ATCC 51888]